MVVVDAEPDRGWLESQRSVEVEPVSGLGVTDQDELASTDTAFGALVSVNDIATPFRT